MQREHTHRLQVLKSARYGGNGHATCQRAWSQPKHFRLPDPTSAATGGAPSSKCRLWSRLHALALRMQRASERRLCRRALPGDARTIDGCPCTPGLLLPVSGAASGTTAAEYAVARVLLRAPARSACAVAGPATQIECKVRSLLCPQASQGECGLLRGILWPLPSSAVSEMSSAPYAGASAACVRADSAALGRAAVAVAVRLCKAALPSC